MLVLNFSHEPEITAHMRNSNVVVDMGPTDHRMTLVMSLEEASGLASKLFSLLSVVEDATKIKENQTMERT